MSLPGELGNAQDDGAPVAAATVLALDGEMTIYRAAELKPVVLEALRSVPVPAFDLSGVTEIDTTGVQLLLLAQRERAAAGGALGIVAASPAVRDALELLELDHLLQPAA